MNNNELDQVVAAMQLFEPNRLMLLAFGILFLIAVSRTAEAIRNSLYGKLPSKRLLISQVTTIFTFIVYVFGGTLVFYASLRPSKELLLAVGGSAAVAIGFSLKDLVASVIAGFILLFDRPFQVGDRVTFAGEYGEIQSIGLRAVRMVTLDDNLVTIPNNRFITDVVASGNAGALDMMIVMDFHLAIDADVNLARDLIFETMVTSRFVYLKKPVNIVISEVIAAQRLCMQLKAKAYVLDTKHEKSFETDVFLRATKALNAHGIKRPLFSNDQASIA